MGGEIQRECGEPIAAEAAASVRAFLHEQGLSWDEGCEYTVNLRADGELLATGSLDGNVLKCMAVSPRCRGEGLAAVLVTELVRHALALGRRHLFVFTAPENRRQFASLGFYPVAQTSRELLMENLKDGVKRFVAGLERPPGPGVTGAVVANCNPFTNGHLYLMEQAARACDWVHLFILSEDRSLFPQAVRLELARRGVEHLRNVLVHPAGSYLISAATFPTYFIKDKALAAEISCELDLTVFADCFAAPMGITRRFVGTESLCPVTGAYNRQMKAFLPGKGIQVEEVPRREADGAPISASRVRGLYRQGRTEELRVLVPPGTWEYLEKTR